MRDLKFKYKLLLILFFIVLLTSLWPNNIYLLVLFSLLTYLVLPLNKYWDGLAIVIFIFSILYSIMTVMSNQYGSGFVLLSYLVAPVAFYRFGEWMLSNFTKESTRQKLFLLIITCYLAWLFVLTIKDIALVGIVNVSRALLADINDNGTLAATLYGLMASVGIGCTASLFAKGQDTKLRLGFVILCLLSLLVVIHLVNRTGLVIFVTCAFIFFMVSARRNLVKIVPTLLLLIILGFVILNYGFVDGDIIDAYQQRELNSTNSASQLGGRSAIWSDAIKQLITHPFGWPLTHYAHNLWLDIARVGGWLSLFPFIVASIVWLKKWLHLMKIHTTFALILGSVNIAILLAAFVEPVIEGSILFFSIMMMVWGFTTVVSKENLKAIQ